MSFDPYAPYGPVVESSVRVVTWNVWGRYGPQWETRQAALEDTLAEVEPDVVCLVEAWRWGESSQPERVARRLGLPYHHFAGDWEQEDWVSGIGLVSRWPMSEPRRHQLRAEDGTGYGEVVHVTVDGDPEIHLKREEIILRGRGRVCFGHAWHDELDEVLTFICLKG